MGKVLSVFKHEVSSCWLRPGSGIHVYVYYVYYVRLGIMIHRNYTNILLCMCVYLDFVFTQSVHPGQPICLPPLTSTLWFTIPEGIGKNEVLQLFSDVL